MFQVESIMRLGQSQGWKRPVCSGVCMGQRAGCLCRGGKRWSGEGFSACRAVGVPPKSWALSLKETMRCHYRALNSTGPCFKIYS